MLQQEKEFNAWGLSKIAVRNIVVFFICLLIMACGVLVRVAVVLDNQRRDSDNRLIECKELAIEAVTKFKDEQLDMMRNFYLRQDTINNRLESLQRKLKRLKQ